MSELPEDPAAGAQEPSTLGDSAFGDSAFGDSAFGRFLVRGEEVFFAIVLGALIVSGLVPIVCRFLDVPAGSWADPLSKHLVLWVALFGAGAATRDRKHISIDAIGHALPPRARRGLRAITELFSAVICGILVPVSITFVREEAEFGGDQPAFFGILKKWLPAVILVGLSLLAVRFLLAAWFDARAALQPPKGRESP